MTTRFFIEQSIMGRWIIVNSEGLAWSGSRWVQHREGIPTGDAQVCNFETREKAESAAREYFHQQRKIGKEN